MRDHNPYLAAAAGPHLSAAAGTGQSAEDKGGPEGIERPGQVENFGWQTRAAAPTPHEDALATALQAIFAEEIYELPQVLERLNRAGVTAPGGAAWTEAVFRAEMRRLGA